MGIGSTGKAVVTATLCLMAVAAMGESARDDVIVGGYDFPPYLEYADEQPVGATQDLIDALNEHQDLYRFRFRETASKRRYSDFEKGRYELIFFEQPEWGWDAVAHQASPVIARDQELYVARNREGRDQTFFQNLSERRLIGYLGYHYGFANMESDTRELRERFEITLSRNLARNLEVILLDRPEVAEVAEVALMNRAFLMREIQHAPEIESRLLIGEEPDQVYRLRALLHPDSELSMDRLVAWLRELEEQGVLDEIRQRYFLAAGALLEDS